MRVCPGLLPPPGLRVSSGLRVCLGLRGLAEDIRDAAAHTRRFELQPTEQNLVMGTPDAAANRKGVRTCAHVGSCTSMKSTPTRGQLASQEVSVHPRS